MAYEFGQIVTDQCVVVVPDARRALGFAGRARGLLGRPKLLRDQAMWIDRCAGVHCIGMCYAIDVLHLSGDGEILNVRKSVPPFGWSVCARGTAVIELLGGNAGRLGIGPGMRLEFVVKRPGAVRDPASAAASEVTG